MGLSDFFKKFVRDDLEDDEADTIYHPFGRNNRSGAAEEEEPEEQKPQMVRRSATPAPAAEEPEETENVTRCKRVVATGIKSAEHAVDLLCRRYVVLVNTEAVKDEVLSAFYAYLAGAVRAVHGHINPIDDDNVFISIEDFDVTPYLPREDAEETEEDLI